MAGEIPAMFADTSALDENLNLVPWPDPKPEVIMREMMGLGKAYRLLLTAGHESMFDQLWSQRR
eukprot:1386660-Alexandrium_andersonii.AAC.1